MKAAYYLGNKQFEVGAGKQRPPAAGEARIAIAFCGVCGTDLHIYHGDMDARVNPPMIAGHEASGIVASVGDGVTNVSVGDHVALRPLRIGKAHTYDRGHEHIGKHLKFIGIDEQGAFQGSLTVPAYTLHKLPQALPLDHAAMIEPLAVACHDVRRGRVAKGDRCVVIGGGPIGLFIALVLRLKGAHVLVSEKNEKRVALIDDLGFDVVNPATENLVEAVAQWSSGGLADVVFEVSGSQAGVALMTALVSARGRIVMVAIHGQRREVDLFQVFWREIELIGARLYEPEDYEEAIRLAAGGDIPFDKIITDTQPLEKIAETFAQIDNAPDGLKYLIDCSG